MPFRVRNNKPSLPDKASQEICDVRGQVDLARTGVGLEILDDAGPIAVHLLAYYNRLTVVDEMLRLQRQRLGDSHPGGGEKNVKRLLVAFGARQKGIDCVRLKRRSALLSR